MTEMTAQAGRVLHQFPHLTKNKTDFYKSIYLEAKRQGRTVKINNTEEAKTFQDCVREGQMILEPLGQKDLSLIAFNIIDKTGDRRIVWDCTDPDQVHEAFNLYTEMVAKGWKAYAVHRWDANRRGLRIYGFDAETEEIIFDDRTVDEKLKNFDMTFGQSSGEEKEVTTIRQKLSKFAETFSEIKLQPKTYPG
jgi:hypothetical protein